MSDETSTLMCHTRAQLMTAFCRIPQSRFRLGTAILASVMYLFASACSLIHSGTLLQTKVVDEALIDGPRGAVFLQKAEDGWFRTAHPLSLSPAVVSSVFQGVQVQTSLTNKAPGECVFSEEDIEFLAPLIHTALTKATKSQVVGFRVIHGTDAGDEITGGILYIQGRLLHLTFTHYRAQGEQSSLEGASGRMIPNPTGLDTRQLAFVPESAGRSSRHEQPDITKTPPLASLVIDYQTLPSWSAPSSTPPPSHPLQPDQVPVSQRNGQSMSSTHSATATHDMSETPGRERDSVQVPSREQETELETLREEMRALQRRLSELDSNMQRGKKP